MLEGSVTPAAGSSTAAPPPAASRARRLVGPVAGLAVGLLFLLLARTIEEPEIATSVSPRWWPELLASLVCAMSVAVGIKDQLVPPGHDDTPIEATRLGMGRVTSVVAAALGYGALWYVVDFRVSTAVFVAGLAFIIGGRGWRALLLFPVVATAVLYAVFDVLLNVPL